MKGFKRLSFTGFAPFFLDLVESMKNDNLRQYFLFYIHFQISFDGEKMFVSKKALKQYLTPVFLLQKNLCEFTTR